MLILGHEEEQGAGAALSPASQAWLGVVRDSEGIGVREGLEVTSSHQLPPATQQASARFSAPHAGGWDPRVLRAHAAPWGAHLLQTESL